MLFALLRCIYLPLLWVLHGVLRNVAAIYSLILSKEILSTKTINWVRKIEL